MKTTIADQIQLTFVYLLALAETLTGKLDFGPRVMAIFLPGDYFAILQKCEAIDDCISCWIMPISKLDCSP